MPIKGWRVSFAILCTSVLAGCGFHMQGEVPLAQPIKHLYLKTDDPYGSLSRNLIQNMQLSHVTLAENPENADTILTIVKDSASQSLLSVSGTQQTRQYNLTVTIIFNLSDAKGNTLLGNESLQESRTITVQSNQILGSSNEATLYYQQMRRVLALAIMNRLSSQEVTKIVNADFMKPETPHRAPKKKHKLKKK